MKQTTGTLYEVTKTIHGVVKCFNPILRNCTKAKANSLAARMYDKRRGAPSSGDVVEYKFYPASN